MDGVSALPAREGGQMSIDWAYMRKGWVSCKKARAAFQENNVEVSEEINAAKDTIQRDEVWDLIADAEKVYVTSGKKIFEFDPESAEKEEVLTKATGRTGNLRAPAVRRGAVFYIGYNDELYATLVKAWYLGTAGMP